MFAADCFELGLLIRPHGVRGQVVAEFDADDPRAYQKLKRVFVQRPDAPDSAPLTEFKVLKTQFTGSEADGTRALLTLEGVSTMDDADALRGATLLLPLTELPPLTGAGQFYYHEVVGFTAIDAAAGELGPVLTFYELPQHDVLAVQHGKFEVLVPVNDEVIRTVDRAQRQLNIMLPDGLLALYTEEPKEREPRTRKARKGKKASNPAPETSALAKTDPAA